MWTRARVARRLHWPNAPPTGFGDRDQNSAAAAAAETEFAAMDPAVGHGLRAGTPFRGAARVPAGRRRRFVTSVER